MAKKSDNRDLLADFLPDAEAIEHREPRGTRRLVLYALLAFVCLAVVWASLSEIDKLVIGRGRLVTPLPNMVVQPLESGMLKSIDVRIGQVVEGGQVLATLDPTFATADVDQISSRAATLNFQALRLQAELYDDQLAEPATGNAQERLQASLLEQRRATYAARMRQFDEQIEQLRAALLTNRRDQEALQRHVSSLEDLEKIYEALETRKMGSRANLLQNRSVRLEIERDYTIAANKEHEIGRQIAATEAERDAFSKDWRQGAMQELASTLQQIDEISDQLAKAKRRSELVTLTAPADAVVLDIGKKSVGSVVTEAEPLFVLVPLNAPLEAEIEISPTDIGEILLDDDARIKIDAYPFQKHGTITGKVSNVSADAFSRPSVSGGDAYYYLTRLRLEDTTLNHLPSPTRLLPGMTLSAEIKTGRRSVISYFLYPVIRVLDESLREP